MTSGFLPLQSYFNNYYHVESYLNSRILRGQGDLCPLLINRHASNDLGKPGSFANLKERTTSLPPLKNSEVLVKIHAVSLQVGRNQCILVIRLLTMSFMKVPRYHDLHRQLPHVSNVQYVMYQRSSSNARQIKESVVPCSDMAGEVIAVGSDVSEWKVGDRVCANFSPEHLHGDATPLTGKAELGGASDGVLTQYKAFKPYVSVLTFRSEPILMFIDRVSWQFPSTCPMKRLPHSHVQHSLLTTRWSDPAL